MQKHPGFQEAAATLQGLRTHGVCGALSSELQLVLEGLTADSPFSGFMITSGFGGDLAQSLLPVLYEPQGPDDRHLGSSGSRRKNGNRGTSKDRSRGHWTTPFLRPGNASTHSLSNIKRLEKWHLMESIGL